VLNYSTCAFDFNALEGARGALKRFSCANHVLTARFTAQARLAWTLAGDVHITCQRPRGQIQIEGDSMATKKTAKLKKAKKITATKALRRNWGGG
jgi:hypothetical protein